MDASTFPWMTMIWQTLAVIAISFVVLVAITSLVRYRLLTDPELVKTDPNASWADRFRIRLLAWIGAKKKKGAFVAGVLRPGRALTADEAATIGRILRAELRPEDELLADGTAGWGLIWNLEPGDAPRLGRRILREIAAAGPDLAPALSFALYPADGETPEALFDGLSDAAPAPGGVAFAGGEAPAETPHAPPPEGMDAETGLLPYESAEHFLQKYLSTQRRKDYPVSFILLTIDRLADLRQRIGVEAGADLMKEFADWLLAELREADPVTRWDRGGFMIAIALAPDDAETLARRLERGAAERVFLADSRKLRLHLSVGVTGFPDVSGAAAVYLTAVEDAHRTAVDRGGRQVVRYEPSMMRQEGQDQPADVF